ncbi:MAG TPA: NADH oxidase [Candidatus Aerophobetes bacterium]|uniref:NADH oxidase n=2 Tax=Aerophobetes bacterium TaxID=2030807 RepID=A0A7V0N195_UNCAE|nr:NADH oxidase [Candidatus Aerophobetes bacterium]
MDKKFPNLFTPGKIGTLEVKNRIIKAPQSTGMSNIDGSVSERLIRHYRELARGGAGLIIVEYAYVDKIASKSAHCQLGICDNEHIPGLAWLADTIKDNGAKAGIQIEHCGRQKFLGTQPIKSSSRIPWPALLERCGRDAIPEELTIDEILDIVEAFGDAAKRAVDAGFDLIEIHGAHGYLLTNFFSPHTNKRNDCYGGSLENRMRIYIQVVRNIREKIGNDFPLTIRLSGTDYEPDGFPIEDTIQLAKALEREGIDAIHVSGGDHHTMIHQVSPMAIPVCHNVWAAEAIKKEVKIPVIASGSITLPRYAEDIIASGKADFVALGRPLWADPYWPQKAMEGRPEDIRPCIRCNEGCLERTFFKFKAVTCAVNPTVGREGELEITPAKKLKKIAVIGGGPAGMEAARVCALRGHNVTIYEKNRLGGVLHEASTPDFKADIRAFRDYLITQINKLNIKVVKEEATPASIKDGGYDVIVVAVGGVPIKPDVPGIDKPIVISALDILNGKKEAKQKVVVVGGGLVGTEIALFLAEQGKDVSIVEMLDEIMKDVATTDKLAYSEKIAKANIKIFTGQKLQEVKDNGVVIVSKNGDSTEIEADTVVIAVGFAPQKNIISEFEKNTGIEVYTIGDCVQPGKIFDAIHTAYKTALRI